MRHNLISEQKIFEEVKKVIVETLRSEKNLFLLNSYGFVGQSSSVVLEVS
jgi:hypothetical protein